MPSHQPQSCLPDHAWWCCASILLILQHDPLSSYCCSIQPAATPTAGPDSHTQSDITRRAQSSSEHSPLHERQTGAAEPRTHTPPLRHAIANILRGCAETLETSLSESQDTDKNREIKQGRDRVKIGSLRRTAVNEAVWQARLFL